MFTIKQEYLKQTSYFHSSYFFYFYLWPWVLLFIFFKGLSMASKTTGQTLPGAGHRVHQTEVLEWQILLVVECIMKWSTRLLLLQEVCDDRLTRKQGCLPFSSLRQISMGFLCFGHPPESLTHYSSQFPLQTSSYDFQSAQTLTSPLQLHSYIHTPSSPSTESRKIRCNWGEQISP